jgi:hypothetical protein
MRMASSSPAPPGVGLGGMSKGGHTEVAGVLCGGHVGTAGWPLGGHEEGARSPMAGLAGGGCGTPVRQLTSEISEAAPIPLRAAFIVSRQALMASPASLVSS